jgi:hypothetical protein
LKVVNLLLGKEVKYMEIHKARIERKDNGTVLKLELNSIELEIILTEDKPNEVKSVFNKLLEQLKSGAINFTLEDEKEDLYHHVCKEYLNQLNTELNSIYQELSDHGLLKAE